MKRPRGRRTGAVDLLAEAAGHLAEEIEKGYKHMRAVLQSEVDRPGWTP